MRSLAVLLLVACESPSPKTECPTPPPIHATEPCAKPPDPVSPTPPALGDHGDARCPVGDMTHVHIYDFLEAELAEADKHDGGPAKTREILELDAKLEKAGNKPRRANVVETQTSHVLATLCAGTPGCKAIGLYNKSGLAFALSSYEMPFGFDAPTWKRLAVKAEGASVVIDGDRYVVFNAIAGRAICIIDETK